jgi:hypothetical protein
VLEAQVAKVENFGDDFAELKSKVENFGDELVELKVSTSYSRFHIYAANGIIAAIIVIGGFCLKRYNKSDLIDIVQKSANYVLDKLKND